MKTSAHGAGTPVPTHANERTAQKCLPEELADCILITGYSRGGQNVRLEKHLVTIIVTVNMETNNKDGLKKPIVLWTQFTCKRAPKPKPIPTQSKDRKFRRRLSKVKRAIPCLSAARSICGEVRLADGGDKRLFAANIIRTSDTKVIVFRKGEQPRREHKGRLCRYRFETTGWFDDRLS